jgi:hypothetical protein
MTAEIALNDSLAADSVLDGEADSVSAVNPDLCISSLNGAAEGTLGVDRGPVPGQLCRNVLSVSAGFFWGVCFGASLTFQRGG